MAWPRLGFQIVDTHFATQRLTFLFFICKRHAQLDRWAFKGWTGLPQPTVFAICPYILNQAQLDPEDARYGRAPRIGFEHLRHVLDAVLDALCRAECQDDLNKIVGALDHVLDWMSAAPVPGIEIPAGISLHRLYVRADEWVAAVELKSIPDKSWSCALIEHAADWRRIEQSMSREFHVIPLASTAALIEESQRMRHCVAPVFWKHAARGKTRLFSIERRGEKYATMELTYKKYWRCLQLKGFQNLELIKHIDDADSPLGRLCRAIVDFYNQHQASAFTKPSGTKTHQVLRGGEVSLLEPADSTSKCIGVSL